ncbi:leucyl aminopeptidase family protein [Roseibacterium sp. SDUM158017]|uniref:leucyl aminopeptidase family protein n=1 Tax=Roseicyclus salinarum TaxID=3036773 RepID=UPI002414F3F7|nr:leucyl aminopeptidase family protein [Roseibacterium sp. SDUM158017]MDG4646854.1 leucyl aminopeptidase family protein [Roseibacterium sp. SDUM158017]
MTLSFAETDGGHIPIRLVDKTGCDAVLGALPGPAAAWARHHGFSGALGQACALPDPSGMPAMVLVGRGDAADRARTRFGTGAAIARLPEGVYQIEEWPEGAEAAEIALGFLLSLYRFSRYREQAQAKARLAPPAHLDAARLERIAAGEALTRDLVNTPAEDMGPTALEHAVRDLAARHGAEVTATHGDSLLDANLPLIHAVGRASDQEPRLIDMTWGGEGPLLTLVGKGVCFDTGGLNLKPGASMGLMKKDMGGAATVLGLAHMIMDAALPLRLRVLIPAVENAVAGSAFRPGDILTARNGMTVEINNTDAEGRLVLADALSLAADEDPELLISMATLTGAARVAVGADIAPFYTDDEALAEALPRAAATVADPVWRMPFHAPYEKMIEPGIADLDNAPKGGFAGSITAALFLRRFAAKARRYAHFDIYAWSPSDAPGRPKGGVGQGARALFDLLPEILSK